MLMLAKTLPAFFCGLTDSIGADSWDHLLEECPIVDTARQQAAINYGIVGFSKNYDFLLLAKANTPVREMVFVVCALYAIWGARLGAQSTSKKRSQGQRPHSRH